MRLFVAIYPPEPALAHLARTVAGLHLGEATASGRSVGLTPRERWHLTLAFLGELPDDDLPAVQQALAGAVQRWREEDRPAPVLRLAGSGRFGRGRFTILWVGLTGDVEPLRDLGRAVRQALRKARLPYDSKPLRPHLTVARPGTRLEPAQLAADVAHLTAYQGPTWTAGAMHLVASRQGPNPAHRTLATYPLAG